MQEKLIQIRKRLETEETIYAKLEKKLHSNPIKNRLGQFINHKLKPSVIEILRSK